MRLEITTKNAEETMLLAQKIAESITPPEVINMVGDLGAGKTTFTKGFAQGLKINDLITSPTFTIMNEFDSGKYPLYHFDLYRIEDKSEIEELGFDEYFDKNKSKGITIIEWAERAKELLPKNYIEVNIQKIDENKRKFFIKEVK